MFRRFNAEYDAERAMVSLLFRRSSAEYDAEKAKVSLLCFIGLMRNMTQKE